MIRKTTRSNCELAVCSSSADCQHVARSQEAGEKNKGGDGEFPEEGRETQGALRQTGGCALIGSGSLLYCSLAPHYLHC